MHSKSTGKIELANRQLLKFFGKTVEELNSWGTNDAVHPDDLPRVIAEITHSITTGTPSIVNSVIDEPMASIDGPRLAFFLFEVQNGESLAGIVL